MSLETEKQQDIHRSSKKDLYEAPDYYLIDELLSDEHKLVRDSVRNWVKKEVSPVIEDFAQKAQFPKAYPPPKKANRHSSKIKGLRPNEH